MDLVIALTLPKKKSQQETEANLIQTNPLTLKAILYINK